MKTKIVVEVLKADNCWNAYSPSVVGCMATGQTPEQAIEKFRAIAGNAIRAALDDARLIEVDVPDEKVRKPQIHEVSRWRSEFFVLDVNSRSKWLQANGEWFGIGTCDEARAAGCYFPTREAAQAALDGYCQSKDRSAK